jgi:hypothetical protein
MKRSSGGQRRLQSAHTLDLLGLTQPADQPAAGHARARRDRIERAQHTLSLVAPRPTVRTVPRTQLLIETDQQLISVLLSETDQQLVIQLARRLARPVVPAADNTDTC